MAEIACGFLGIVTFTDTLYTLLEFHGMDPEVLQKSLGILVKRGKAQVFGNEDQQGVKFF